MRTAVEEIKFRGSKSFALLLGKRRSEDQSMNDKWKFYVQWDSEYDVYWVHTDKNDRFDWFRTHEMANSCAEAFNTLQDLGVFNPNWVKEPIE
jgi:hypothetical protein